MTPLDWLLLSPALLALAGAVWLAVDTARIKRARRKLGRLR